MPGSEHSIFDTQDFAQDCVEQAGIAYCSQSRFDVITNRASGVIVDRGGRAAGHLTQCVHARELQ